MSTKPYIFGFHALINHLQGPSDELECVYVIQTRQDRRMKDLLALAKAKNIPIETKDQGVLDRLAQHENHQGVVGILGKARVYQEHDIPGLVGDISNSTLMLILDGVQDPHNLGACLRSADGAGVSVVIAPKDHACSVTPVVKKVASGAAESVPFIQVTNLARTLCALKEQGIWLIGLDDQASDNLYQTDLNLPCAIVMGSEGKGLRRLTKKHCDILTYIPMFGAVSSLNVSVATGVCLFEAKRQKS